MKQIQITSLLVLVILIIACSGQNIDKTAIENTQLNTEQSDITKRCKEKYFRFPMVKYALHQAFGEQNTNSERRGHHKGHSKPDCVTINNDTANKTVTIDYGTSCNVSRKNTTKMFSGKLVITYTGKPSASGGGYTIEAQNLTIDGQAVTYKKTIANLESSTTAYKVSVKEEGEITLTNGIKVAISKDITKTVTLDTDSRPTSRSVEGNTSLTDNEGKTYKVTISKAIVSKKECATTNGQTKRRGHRGKHHGRRGRHGKGFPIEGTKTVESNGKTITLDFGDGTCDKKVSITSGTETKEVDFSTETSSLKNYIKTYFN